LVRQYHIDSSTNVIEDAEHGFFYDVTRECQRRAIALANDFLLRLEKRVKEIS